MRRFTDTDKWSDPWFQNLPHGSKLLFMYFCDKCNNGGFYEQNVGEACFHLKITEDQYNGAIKALDRGIKQSEGWVWVKNFLKHQKNLPLNKENPAHKQIIFQFNEQSERFSKIPEFKEFTAPLKGLLRPIGKGIGKGKSLKQPEVCEEIYQSYPRHEARGKGIDSIESVLKSGTSPELLLERVRAYSRAVKDKPMKFIPLCSTWFNQKRWEDDEAAWNCHHEDDGERKNGAHSNGNGLAWRSEAEKVVRAAQDLQDAFLPGSVHPHLNRLKPQLVSGEFQTFARSKLKDEDYLRIEPLLGKYL